MKKNRPKLICGFTVPLRNAKCKLLSAFTLMAVFSLSPCTLKTTLISGSASVGLPSGIAGTGLNAEYYNQGPGDGATADGIIASNSPAAKFTATLLDYPNGGVDSYGYTATVSQFLGVDAFEGLHAADLISGGMVLRFTGYIKITSDFDTVPGGTIDVNFALGSDDESRLRIGGVTVIDKGGGNFWVSSATASFESEGLYPIEVIYDNCPVWGGGVELSSSIPGGPDSGAPPGTVGILPTSVLYTAVPEPSSLAYMGFIALGSLAFVRQCRRK